MAASVDKVMEFVERELKKNPKISNEKLFEGAKKINRAVARLSARQFHAKYPLQVKRRRTNGKKKRSNGKAKRAKAPRATQRRTSRGQAKVNSNDTAAVRRVLMRFAKDLASADSQPKTIEVMANLDSYVAAVVKAARN